MRNKATTETTLVPHRRQRQLFTFIDSNTELSEPADVLSARTSAQNRREILGVDDVVEEVNLM